LVADFFYILTFLKFLFLSVSLPHSDLGRWFRAADLSGDGQVDYSEFTAVMLAEKDDWGGMEALCRKKNGFFSAKTI
jgi:hypothetical protein